MIRAVKLRVISSIRASIHAKIRRLNEALKECKKEHMMLTVKRRVISSIHAEMGRLEKALSECNDKNDKESIRNTLELRYQQYEYNLRETRHIAVEAVRVTEKGLCDPVLRYLDRKVSYKVV